MITTRAKNAASGRFTDGVYKNILDPTQIYTKYVKILVRNFFQSELYLETHYEIILEHTYIWTPTKEQLICVLKSSHFQSELYI